MSQVLRDSPVPIVSSISRQLSPGSSAGQCHSYYGLVHNAQTNQHDKAFIKVIEPERRDNALAAEITAFHLARHFGLSVAPDVYVAACPVKLLDRKVHGTNRKSDFTRVLVSVDASPPGAPAAKLSGQLLESELLRWKYIERTAVFDELIFNPDRNRGNLIHTGRHSFVIIDHEQAFGPLLTEGAHDRIFLTEPIGCNSLVQLIVTGDCELRVRRLLKVAREMMSVLITNLSMPEDLVLCRLEERQWSRILSLVRRRQVGLERFMLSYIERVKRGRVLLAGS
jgi:hypothetical protein